MCVDEDRNDLYVTLLDGSFARANKATDRNVEATACLCDETGRPVVPSLIHAEVAASLQALTSHESAQSAAYKTLVYYHNGSAILYEYQ